MTLSFITEVMRLEEYVKPNKYGNLSIEFSNPKAVIALNKALLSFFYGTKNWNMKCNEVSIP